MSQPFFTIVIPTYNRAGFILKTIDTILAQSFGNFEVIVIDDGSSDNTNEVMKSITDGRVQYVKKQNGERGAARNAGARLAKGKYINFVDSDDVLYPNHTEEAHRVISRDPSIKVFHLGYDVKEGDGKFLRNSSNIGNINKQLLTGNVLSCNAVFMEKEVALANPFSENRVLSAIEDWELWLRLAAKYPITHVPVITSTVVQHDERSVMSVNTDRIKAKMNLFIDMVSSNGDIRKTFGANVDKIIASVLTYTALHIAIAKADRSEILSLTRRGILKNPGEMLSKRFFVILKLLVLR